MQKEKNGWFTLEHGDQLMIRSDGKMCFRFRQDPVPDTKRSRNCRYLYRSYRTAREKRAYGDRDMAAYARPRRKHELSIIFEVGRVTEKNWKSYRKHQWK